MPGIPYAFSVHHFVSSVGAYAGFAAILGLAVLILLYFAQAREAATLRARLAEITDQLARLEPRLVQLTRAARSQPDAARSAPVAPPVPAYAGAGAPVVSRRPAFAGIPSAPAGVGAPPLADATRLIPDPAPAAADAGAEREPLEVGVGIGTAAAVGAGAVRGIGAGDGGWRSGRTDLGAAERSGAGAALAEPPAGPPPATAAGANGLSRGAPVETAAARPVPAAPPPAASRAGAGANGRSLPPEYRVTRHRSPGARAALALVAVLLVAAVVVAVAVLTSSGSSSSGTGASQGASATAKHGHNRQHVQHVVIDPAKVTVAVLNGTTVNGLAGSVSSRLKAKGFKPGSVTNAANQAQATTAVGYQPGQRDAALLVAKELGLSQSDVAPVSPSALSAACPASQTSCAAGVVVTVGSDLAGSSSATTTT